MIDVAPTGGRGGGERRIAVVALGGNALAPAGEPATIYNQFRHTRESLAPIVDSRLASCIIRQQWLQPRKLILRQPEM